MIANGRRTATDDFSDLLRRQSFGPAQQKHQTLLLGQTGGQTLEDTGDLAAVQLRELTPVPAVGHLSQMMANRLGAALSATPGSEVIDGEIGGDPIKPGIGAPALGEGVTLLPHPDKGDLDDVLGLGPISHNAIGQLHQRARFALDQLVERLFIAALDGTQKVAIRDLAPLDAVAAL